MTVSELIVKLCDAKPISNVKVAVHVHTRKHTVAVVEPFEVDYSYDGCTLWISLPENMHVVERKGGA